MAALPGRSDRRWIDIGQSICSPFSYAHTDTYPFMTGGWADVRAALQAKAEALGFARVGVTTPEPAPRLEAYKAWVAEGKHGEMGFVAESVGLAMVDRIHWLTALTLHTQHIPPH